MYQKSTTTWPNDKQIWSQHIYPSYNCVLQCFDSDGLVTGKTNDLLWLFLKVHFLRIQKPNLEKLQKNWSTEQKSKLLVQCSRISREVISVVICIMIHTHNTYRSAACSFNCRASVLVNWPTQLNPPSSSSRPWRRPFSSAKRLSSLVSPGWCSSSTVAWAICKSPQFLWILPDLPLHNHTNKRFNIRCNEHTGCIFSVYICINRIHQRNCWNTSIGNRNTQLFITAQLISKNVNTRLNLKRHGTLWTWTKYKYIFLGPITHKP